MDPDTRSALAQYLARLKHDLGKYVAFQQRWLGPEATLAQRHEALVADLTETRRGPEGSVDAPTVWAEFRPVLVGDRPLPDGVTVDLSADRDVRRIDHAMTEIVALIGALRDPDDEAAVLRAEAAALMVADACRQLVRRVRAGEI